MNHDKFVDKVGEIYKKGGASDTSLIRLTDDVVTLYCALLDRIEADQVKQAWTTKKKAFLIPPGL
jgi:hypothetical protein